MYEEKSSNELEIDLKELVVLLLRRLWLIALLAAIAGVSYYLISPNYASPYYCADTTVYILYHKEESTVSVNDMQTGDYLTKDYQNLIKSRKVLEDVIEQLSLEYTSNELANNITVTVPADTRLMTMTVKDEIPERAMEIANTLRKVATIHINKVMQIQAVTEVDEAKLPVNPILPNYKKNTVVVSLLVGTMVAGIIVVTRLLSDKIRTPKEIEGRMGLPVLTVIPEINEVKLYKKFIKERKRERIQHRKQITKEEKEYKKKQRQLHKNMGKRYEGVND